MPDKTTFFKGFEITEAVTDDLIEFLQSLTDEEFITIVIPNRKHRLISTTSYHSLFIPHRFADF